MQKEAKATPRLSEAKAIVYGALITGVLTVVGTLVGVLVGGRELYVLSQERRHHREDMAAATQERIAKAARIAELETLLGDEKPSVVRGELADAKSELAAVTLAFTAAEKAFVGCYYVGSDYDQKTCLHRQVEQHFDEAARIKRRELGLSH